MIRGTLVSGRAKFRDAEDGRLSIRATGKALDRHVPVRGAGGQLGLSRLAFRKDGGAGRCQQSVGVNQQLRKWRQRAGGQAIQRRERHMFYSAMMDFDIRKPHDASGLTEESAFARIRFHEMERLVRQSRGENQAWKPGTASKVGDRAGGHQWCKLAAVLDMPRPPFVRRSRAHQVDVGVPGGQ